MALSCFQDRTAYQTYSSLLTSKMNTVLTQIVIACNKLVFSSSSLFRTMKDPRYNINAWTGQALTLCIRIDPGPPSPARPLLITNQAAVAVDMPSTCKIIRSSEESLDALRNLPSTSTILLLTPVLIPAGSGKAPAEQRPIDPFEAFGRALHQFHKRIRHVPYVPKVGFTETHNAFISQADAVITVVCEPAALKHQSVSNQMDFAEAALDAVESKEASASDVFVLVQCGADQFRLQADAGFTNVVESSTYDAEMAKQIADSVFCSEH